MTDKTTETICQAWQTKNPELLNDILADSFIWQETPYDEPITDKKQLMNRWDADLAGQTKILVSSDVISRSSEQVISHWNATFSRDDKPCELDGIFVLTLDTAGRLVGFRQWWVTK